MGSAGHPRWRLRAGLGLLLVAGFSAVLVGLFCTDASGPNPSKEPPVLPASRPPASIAFVEAAPSPGPDLSGPPHRTRLASPRATGNELAAASTHSSGATLAGAAAVVRVTLRLPEAWGTPQGFVYALPAGEPGRSRDVTPPNIAVTDAEAHEAGVDPRKGIVLSLPLPRDGLWDVGFVGPFGHVLVPDVPVQEETDVLVEAREVAPIQFHVRGTADPGARGAVLVTTADGVEFPGRGQVARVALHLDLGSGGDLATPPLPRGTEHQLRAWSPIEMRAPGGTPGFEWSLSRSTARAGDDVDLFLVPLGLVRVLLTIDRPLPESWFDPWDAVEVYAEAQGESGTEPSRVATGLRKDGTFEHDVLLMPLPPGRYTFECGPARVFQGTRRAVTVRAGEAQEIEARATLDPKRNAAAGSFPGADEPGTRVTLQADAPPREGWALAAQVRDGDGLRWEDHGKNGPSEMIVSSDQPIRQAVLVLPPDRASEAFVPPSRGDCPVTLEPAGMLVLVPDVAPDERLGGLRVRRADGLPLPLYVPGDPRAQIEFAGQPEVKVGLVLGPIAQGRLPLEVLLGGVIIGRPVVEVRAGKYTPVAIPLPSVKSR